jgi:hypothetical protein
MGDAAEKLYDDAMKLPPRERRAFALRVLATLPEAEELERVTARKKLRSLQGIGSDPEATGKEQDRFLYGAKAR